MKQQYFIVVLAHSLHGRLRRLHVPHSVLYGVLALALFGAFSLFGIAASYLRMAWKVSNYNNLRVEVNTLRERYQVLQKESDERNKQLATFQLYATEVSTMFGLKRAAEGPESIAAEGRLVPTVPETLAEYNYLKHASFSTRSFRAGFGRVGTSFTPSLWPVQGGLMSHFGMRVDPFSGLGAYHTGVDISAGTGTPVRATADGTVIWADRFAAYGKTVRLAHGNGCETLYAHLSRYEVLPGQTVQRGDIIAYSGSTGRATAPHLHFEVRMKGTPVNPYRFLANSAVAMATKKDLPF